MDQRGTRPEDVSRTLARTIALPVACAAVLVGVFYWEIQRLLAHTTWVSQADRVIAAEFRVQKLLLEMESGVRGYLLTGDPAFREPYLAAAATFPDAYEELRGSLVDRPSEAARVDTLLSLHKEWHDFARHTMRLKDAGGDYLGAVASGFGKRKMDAMHTELQVLIDEEHSVRAHRLQSAEAATRRVIAISSMLALVVAVAVAFDARRQLVAVARTYRRALDEARAAADALRESEETNRLMIEAAQTYAICRLDSIGRFQSWNTGAHRILGHTADTMLGAHFATMFTSDDRDRGVPEFALASARDLGKFETTGWLTRQDGGLIWAQLSLGPLADPGPGGFLLVVGDITERKTFEEAIAQAAREYKGLFENARDGIVIVDPDHSVVLDANQRACALLGLSAAKIVGRRVSDLFDGEASSLPAPSQSREVRVGRNGDERIVDTTASAVVYRGRTAVMLIARDVTDRRRAEVQIRRLNEELELRVARRTEQLEAANRELEAFSYSVSHDLRAPLRAIDGFSRILAEDLGESLSEEAREYLELVRDNSNQMGRLIDDLLAFARLGRQPIRASLVDVDAMVRSIAGALVDQARERRVEFRIDQLPPCSGDPSLLKQVFVNLLSNAVKYTRDRQHAVVEIGKGQPVNGEVVYYVRDNGAGFDMKYAHKLFGVFQRLHRAEDFEGTGVGLAIVQRVVSRHGGRVWAEGAIGKGATFFVALPGHEESDR